MKRIFNVFLIVLVGLFAFVACSPQASFSDELVNVSILGSQNKTRSLVAENDFDIANVKVWKYTAEKADQGLATGATDDPIALTKDTETGSWMTKALSQGAWNFELFGYSDDAGSVLICSGTVENQTITSKSHNVKITVKPSQTATGAIKVKNDIKIVDEKGSVYSGNVYTMDYTVANSSSEDVTATVKAGTNVPSGRYKVTVVFTSKVNGEDYTAAKADKYINVYDNLTTTVSGTITETEQAAAIVAEGGMISATSESFEVAVENGTNKAEVSIPVASTPVGTTDSAKKTTVTFPAGALNLSSSDTSADVSLKVESTSIESTATSYSVETSEGVAVASFNFELVGAENAEFNGDDGVEITTYIAKGLGDDAVSIKYVGTSTGKAPKLVSYTSETGELKFKVFHFSTYYVIAEDACIYNASKDMTYESIDRAVVAASEGDTLILLDCSKSNDVSDEAADAYNWNVIHNNCASAADGYWHEKSDSFDGGYGTKVEPYLVANREQFQAIGDMSENYGYYKWFEKDGTLDGSDWKVDDIYLCGSFDGNGLKITELDSYLFAGVWNGLEDYHPSNDKTNTYVIKNLDITAKIIKSGWTATVAMEVGVHNFVMDNVNVHGYIEGSTGVASFICFGPGTYASDNPYWQYAGNITFKDCHSDMTVVAKAENAVGFIAHPMMTDEGKITLVDSDFTGSMSAVSLENCKYISGNSISATISDDNQNASSLYDSTVNGWKYINSGKTSVVTFEDKSISDFSVAVGDAIAIDAAEGAASATVSLVISPGPKCFRSTYLSETASLTDNKFTSSTIKYFTVRINPEGSDKTGINGNNYDVVNSVYTHSIDADTVIRFDQYDSAGNLLKVTNISLGDKTETN